MCSILRTSIWNFFKTRRKEIYYKYETLNQNWLKQIVFTTKENNNRRKVTIPTDKLKTKKKFKKKTNIVEETKEAVNKIEESEYIEFQSEVIQITEETEKPAKRTYIKCWSKRSWRKYIAT